MTEKKHSVPDFMRVDEFVERLNSLNDEFTIHGSRYSCYQKPYIRFFVGGDMTIADFLTGVFQKIGKDHPRYFEVLHLLLRVRLQENKATMELLMAENELLEFKAQLAGNGIDFPDDLSTRRADYEILLLEKTKADPERLAALLAQKKKPHDARDLDIFGHYKKRPFQN